VLDEDWAFLKKHKSGIPGQVKNDYRQEIVEHAIWPEPKPLSPTFEAILALNCSHMK